MPHSPYPFFKQKRNRWYVEIDRVQHLLGKHPEDLPPPRKKGGRWEPVPYHPGRVLPADGRTPG